MFQIFVYMSWEASTNKPLPVSSKKIIVISWLASSRCQVFRIRGWARRCEHRKSCEGVFFLPTVWLHVTLHYLNVYRTGYCMTWFNPGFWHVKRDSELIFLKHISLGRAIHYKHIEPCWRSKTIKRFSFGKKFHFHANINFLIVYSSNITAAQRLYSCLLCSWQLMMIKMYNVRAGPSLVWKGLN